MINLKKQNGFTIVELLIAITVFSMVLLICSAAIIYIGRMYYKGSLISRTQEVSREVIEDVALAVQFGPRDAQLQTGSGGGYESYCIGNTRYTYSTGVAQSSGSPVLWRDRIGGSGGSCSVADFTEPSGVELLDEKMRLPEFDITTVSDVWSIDVTVAYGDELDLFIDSIPLNGCISVDIGGQFCATSTNSTTVVKRL